MTSASDEKWRPFNCFFSRVGLRTYQHPCKVTAKTYDTSKYHAFQVDVLVESVETFDVGWRLCVCVCVCVCGGGCVLRCPAGSLPTLFVRFGCVSVWHTHTQQSPWDATDTFIPLAVGLTNRDAIDAHEADTSGKQLIRLLGRGTQFVRLRATENTRRNTRKANGIEETFNKRTDKFSTHPISS